jgi:hypothetical protein
MTVAMIETRLRALKPIQQVALCQAIVARLYRDSEAVQEAAQALDPALRDDPAFARLAAEAAGDPSAKLGAELSGHVAETFLLAAASDPDLSPLLGAELDAFRDEKQFVETALALGLAISMIIVAATTRVKYSDGKVTIDKTTASPGLVKAAMAIAGAITG